MFCFRNGRRIGSRFQRAIAPESMARYRTVIAEIIPFPQSTGGVLANSDRFERAGPYSQARS
jgi:hypothetical protein